SPLHLFPYTTLFRSTVVSGIAEYFAPEDIVGKQVSILVNLEPREIKGIQSQGMILMAEDADGRLDFVNPTSAIQPGSTVRYIVSFVSNNLEFLVLLWFSRYSKEEI